MPFPPISQPSGLCCVCVCTAHCFQKFVTGPIMMTICSVCQLYSDDLISELSVGREKQAVFFLCLYFFLFFAFLLFPSAMKLHSVVHLVTKQCAVMHSNGDNVMCLLNPGHYPPPHTHTGVGPCGSRQASIGKPVQSAPTANGARRTQWASYKWTHGPK